MDRSCVKIDVVVFIYIKKKIFQKRHNTATMDSKEETKQADTRLISKDAGGVISRPSFETIYMNLAEQLSARSTCQRLQVGTVITSNDYRKVLSIGYNGNAIGLHNGCDSKEPGQCGDLHSEINAIINYDSPRGIHKKVFVTHSPCKMCAKSLINMGGVETVFYRNEYRDTSSLDLLESVGIKVV